MAGNIKGAVAFDADGAPYTLLLDFNALCDLEQDFPGIMDGQFEVKSPSAIRKVFRAGLAEHHPDTDDRAAGRIIQAVGIERAAQLVGEAFAASFPEAAKSNASPRKAPAKAGAGNEA